MCNLRGVSPGLKDGAKVNSCAHPSVELHDTGKAVYDQEKRVVEAVNSGDMLKNEFEDLVEQCYNLDMRQLHLIIAANGSTSCLRQLWQTHLHYNDAAYVAWRDTDLESDVTQQT